MEDKRSTESVVQEIMGLVDDVLGCDSAGYQFECKRQIQSKLRELVERCSVREPLEVKYPEDMSSVSARFVFSAGWHAAERAHNIANTTKE